MYMHLYIIYTVNFNPDAVNTKVVSSCNIHIKLILAPKVIQGQLKENQLGGI